MEMKGLLQAVQTAIGVRTTSAREALCRCSKSLPAVIFTIALLVISQIFQETLLPFDQQSRVDFQSGGGPYVCRELVSAAPFLFPPLFALLDLGYSVTDARGATPLHYASWCDDLP